MATLATKFIDLIDSFKRSDDENKLKVATIIELLKETNAFLDDGMTMKCNNGTNHKTTIRTGLPAVTWGQLYRGIAQSKSTTAQVQDATGFLQGLSTIDMRLLDLHENEGALRLSEATSFLESLSQDMAAVSIYGNVALDGTTFTGFAPRFSSLSAVNGGQIVDGGGVGSDNTSIWIVTWADSACHFIHPSTVPGGIQRKDMGEQRVNDDEGNPYYVKEEMFTWHNGLTVRDWRQVARVANIDVSELRAGNVDIYALLRQAYWKLKKHRVTGGRIAIYANSDVLEALDAQSTPTMSTTSSFVRLTPQNVDGKEVMTYRGMPVRQVDAILNTEARVVA